MITAKLENAKGKTPPNHFDMRTFSLFEKDFDSEDNLVMSISHYLPGGGAEIGLQPIEIIFYVLDGELTIITDSGDIALLKGEAIHISRGENKGIKNNTNYPATMLLVGAFPPDFVPPGH